MKLMFMQPGTVIGGRYEIRGVISTGSFGVVYRANDIDQGVDVALKTLHTQAIGIPEHVGRFKREARLGSMLDHPNIVPHLASGEIDEEHGGGPFLVLGLIRGLPLGDMIDNRGPLSVDEASHVLSHVLEALDAVHRLGAIHRDLKPDNILVAVPTATTIEIDPTGTIAGRVGIPEAKDPVWQDLTQCHVTLLDFGLGKFLTASGQDFTKITSTGMAAGTLYYMSPEQIQAAKDLDYRADIYGAAMLLFRMLDGNPPYDGQMMLQIASSHLEAPPPPLPNGLDAHPIGGVYRRGAMKKRDERYISAAEMAWALRASVDPEMDTATPPAFKSPLGTPEAESKGFWAKLFKR